MLPSLTLFLENMYWIDIIVILCISTGYYLMIQSHAKKILDKNQKYNKELKEMRSEIYTEYEKNFFL